MSIPPSQPVPPAQPSQPIQPIQFGGPDPSTVTTLINITINKFQPLGCLKGNIVFQMSQDPTTDSGFVSLTPSGTLVVAPAPSPTGMTSDVTFAFVLNDPDHIIIGVGFTPDNTPIPGAGVVAFPTIEFTRGISGSNYQSMMVVTDTLVSSSMTSTYSYTIYVQEVSTATIGIIDPMIVNEPNA